MVQPPAPLDPFLMRRGGCLVGLSTDRPASPGPLDEGIYLETDTHRAYLVHFGEWTLMPVVWQAADNTERDSLPGSVILNEGDWCYVYGTRRYSFWNGTQWRQVRF